jgi:putative ABC transport system permease protein
MSWLRRVVNTFRSGRVQRDIDREISFHIEERIDYLRAHGMSDEEARRAARIQFGNPLAQRDRTRDVDIAAAVDAAMRNIRYALRAMRRTPGFTATVVVTLALGIGANSAVFSAIDAVLLRPLPYPDADRLVELTQVHERSGQTRVAPVRLQDWIRLNTTFDGIAGYMVGEVVDTSGELPERIQNASVTAGFFDVLGVRPAMGRTFSREEHHFGYKGPEPVIFSHRRWRSLGPDRQALDQPVRIGNSTIATIGVMPPTFEFLNARARGIDVWIADDAGAPWTLSRTQTWFTGIGRLKPGVTLEQARADLERVQAQLGAQYPDTDRGLGVRIVPLKDTLVSGTRTSLWVLYGAVSVLLLIACTNIAALLLSRAASREHEIAVRYSLGGSRTAVAMQLLTEAAVLSFIGALIGVAVAIGASRALRLLAPDLPRVGEIAIDARILAYTMLSTLFVTFVCGLAPAIHSTRRARYVSGSTRTTTSARHSLQWLLVGVQIALSVTLLAGAGLLVRSIDAMSRVRLGFDPTHILTLRVSGQYGVETTDSHIQRINRVLDSLESLPGVEGVAIASRLPGVRDYEQREFVLLEGRAETAPPLIAEARIVSPGYFAALRIPLLTGELCRRPANSGWPKAPTTDVLVNRTFADRYFRGTAVLGLHLTGGLDWLVKNRHIAGALPSRIVGVVGDAREAGADREPAPTVYTCFSYPNPAPWHVIRTAGDPAAAVTAIRRTIRELEPLRSVYDIAPLEQRIGDAYAQNRLRMWLLSLFAITALALVCASVYGTLAYAVNLRRREVALRLALGALRTTVVRQLIDTSIRVVAVASIVGLGLALLFTRSLSTMLYGVTPADPATLTGVVAMVVTVASIAAAVPAARAAFMQPMRALREE